MWFLNLLGVIAIVYIANGAVFKGLCRLDDTETFTKEQVKEAINKRRRK